MRRMLLAALLFGCTSDPSTPTFEARPLEFTSGTFTVDPGTERTVCKYVDLPRDSDFLVAAYHAEMLPGSHHFNMFHADPVQQQLADVPRDELVACRDIPFRVYLAGSQWSEVDQTFPEGVAARIPEGSVIIMEIHYVNFGDSEIEGNLDVTFEEADPAELEQELGLYFNVMEDIRVEPGQRARLSGVCPVDEGAEIVLMTSHMHHFGSAFEINLVDDTAGTKVPIYLSEDWSHPVLSELWNDPIVLGPDQHLEWACTYDNPGPDLLTDGDSASTEEMCIMAAFYLPNLRPHPYCFDSANIEILN